MIRLDRKTHQPCPVADATVTLDFDARQKSRQRVILDDGREAGLLLVRGTVLADGDILTDAEGGIHVRVLAATEALSYVHCLDRLLLNRVCYHLGNRHVPLQVTCEAVAYRHDHVLDAMVTGLGATPRHCCCAFHPEAGAYEGYSHSHGRGHTGDDRTGSETAASSAVVDEPVARCAHG